MKITHKQNIIAAALAYALHSRARTRRRRPTASRRASARSNSRRDSLPRRPRARCSTRSTTSEPCRPICGLIRRFRSSPSWLQTSGTCEPISTTWSSPTTSPTPRASGSRQTTPRSTA